MFDVLLCNKSGHLTEFTRGNLVVKHGNSAVTPAIACGLLPGVYRAELLARGEIVEGLLTPEFWPMQIRYGLSTVCAAGLKWSKSTASRYTRIGPRQKSKTGR